MKAKLTISKSDVIGAIDPVAKTAPDAKINAVKAEVNKLMKDYPLFAW